jgi:hypothetical protein
VQAACALRPCGHGDRDGKLHYDCVDGFFANRRRLPTEEDNHYDARDVTCPICNMAVLAVHMVDSGVTTSTQELWPRWGLPDEAAARPAAGTTAAALLGAQAAQAARATQAGTRPAVFGDPDNQCHICRDRLDQPPRDDPADHDTAVISPCEHRGFHWTCLNTWYSTRNIRICVLCNGPVDLLCRFDNEQVQLDVTTGLPLRGAGAAHPSTDTRRPAAGAGTARPPTDTRRAAAGAGTARPTTRAARPVAGTQRAPLSVASDISMRDVSLSPRPPTSNRSAPGEAELYNGQEIPRGYVVGEDRTAPGVQILKRIDRIFWCGDHGKQFVLSTCSRNSEYPTERCEELSNTRDHPSEAVQEYLDDHDEGVSEKGIISNLRG